MPSASALVSKPCACASGGSIEARIDLDAQQIANRVGVFRSIESMEVGRPARIRTRGAARSSSVSSHVATVS